ncbi:MAG TPA: glycoside hydrolase family 3 N-terminal domain-containing protein, partial [Bacteroidales bacterium]|nr:glycoside hydrolase family 3 N-terminal domain-containing protein [Bacteroidales bacterium]
MLIIKDIYRSVIVVGALLVFLSPARGYSQHSHSSPHPSQIEDRWVDSVYNALTPQERIGQLLMIRAKSTGDSAEYRAIADYIRQYNLGGICFFQGGPVRQAMLTNYYQSLAKTPIFISMDAEWGLGMRLDSTISFARAMTLGAIADTTLITECGFMIGEHLKRLGVHIDFAPVLDVNINPANPIINIRSFGEEVDDVIIKARCFNRGLSRSVLTVAKHFPGHGDTDTDSHYTLPVLQHSLKTLENTDINPFSALMHEVAGIMIGHLYVPALDSSSGLPASLSAIIIDSLLRHKMNFAGLVFTDALDMKGVANYAGPGTAEIKALLAGNDILLLPQSVSQAVDAILKAIENGTIPENLIEDKCRKVLLAKYRFGLTDNKNVFVEVEHLAEDLNSPLAESLNHKLYENSVTLLKNEREIIPILHPNVVRIACLTIGDDVPGAFEQRLDSYAPIDHFFVRRDFSI